MNIKLKRLLAFVTVFVLLNLAPAFAQPGSADDPLVSKKYVDDQVSALKALISQSTMSSPDPGSTAYGSDTLGPDAGVAAPVTQPAAEITDEMRGMLVAEALVTFEQVYGEMLRQAAANAEASLPPQVSTGGAAFFDVVFAESGRVIYGDSSTEMILRGGSATVVCGENSLCDVTNGEDLANGANVPYNHLVIIPVGDGRGVRVTSDAYLMIKGGYYFG